MNFIPKTGPGKSQAGFTLIELLVVIAVLLITFTVAIPNATRMIEQKQLNDVSQSLVSYIYLARSESVARSNQVFLIVNKTADGIDIGVSTTSTCDPSDNVPVCDIARVSGSDDVTDAFLRTADDDKILQFNPFDSTVTTTSGTWPETFVLSVSGVEDDPCKTISVFYLGQIRVDTGQLASDDGICS